MILISKDESEPEYDEVYWEELGETLQYFPEEAMEATNAPSMEQEYIEELEAIGIENPSFSTNTNQPNQPQYNDLYNRFILITLITG